MKMLIFYFCKNYFKIIIFVQQKMINFLILQLIFLLIQCSKNYLIFVKIKRFHYQLVFSKKENKFFNSLVMIDSFGKISEVYNKSHIPEGPGYNEKYYFEKGNTGFMVFDTLSKSWLCNLLGSVVS